MFMYALLSVFLFISTSYAQGGYRGIPGGIDGGVTRYGEDDYEVVLVPRTRARPVVQVRPQPIAIRQPVVQPIAVVRPQPVIRPQVLSRQVEDYGPPQPFEFAYTSTDEYGTTSSRQESSDGNRVTGSYSYQDAQGLYRTVEYVADENGYRATVKTNEPGTDNQSPADVQLNAEAPPANVVQQWLQAGGSRRIQAK
jgi:hypothetical protein